MDETNTIIIVEDDGTEREMEIVLTFQVDEDRKYVLVTDPEDHNEEVYPFRYDDDGNLYEIENDDEFKMCEEVLHTFLTEGLDA